MSRDGGGRLVFLDAARTVACVLVVLVHANLGTRPGLYAWWPGGMAGAPAYSLAVPLFFTIAAFLAERGLAKEPPGRWFRARLARLLPPYFAWNAILLATGAQGAGLAAGERLFHLVFGARHMYFVCALFQLFALHAWLGRRAPGRILLAASFGATAAYFLAADAAGWAAGLRAQVFESGLNRLFPAWAAFYAAGAWLAREEEAFESVRRFGVPLALLAAGSYAAFVLELRAVLVRFGFHPVRQFLASGLPLQLAGTLLVLERLRSLETSGRARSLLARLAGPGPDTLGIYLSHVSVETALFALALRLGDPGTDAADVPILAAASWVVCRAGIAAARRLLPPRAAAMLLGIAPAPTGT